MIFRKIERSVQEGDLTLAAQPEQQDTLDPKAT